MGNIQKLGALGCLALVSFGADARADCRSECNTDFFELARGLLGQAKAEASRGAIEEDCRRKCPEGLAFPAREAELITKAERGSAPAWLGDADSSRPPLLEVSNWQMSSFVVGYRYEGPYGEPAPRAEDLALPPGLAAIGRVEGPQQNPSARFRSGPSGVAGYQLDLSKPESLKRLRHMEADWSFVVWPAKVGIFRIGPTTLTVNGRVLTSKPVTLTVVPNGTKLELPGRVAPAPVIPVEVIGKDQPGWTPAPEPAPRAAGAAAGARAPWGCPPGTAAKGDAPPAAYKRWCERPDGIKDGPEEEWHPSGKRSAEGQWAGGKMVGRWRAWRPDGSVLMDEVVAPVPAGREGKSGKPGRAGPGAGGPKR